MWVSEGEKRKRPSPRSGREKAVTQIKWEESSASRRVVTREREAAQGKY